MGCYEIYWFLWQKMVDLYDLKFIRHPNSLISLTRMISCKTHIQHIYIAKQ